MAELTLPAPVPRREFDEIFEAVKNWGRWGPEDRLLGALTPAFRTMNGTVNIAGDRRRDGGDALHQHAGQPDHPGPELVRWLAPPATLAWSGAPLVECAIRVPPRSGS